jgi:hypothetical protein
VKYLTAMWDLLLNIDTEEQEVIVQYQERDVTYDYADLNELALAWSVTSYLAPTE